MNIEILGSFPNSIDGNGEVILPGEPVPENLIDEFEETYLVYGETLCLVDELPLYIRWCFFPRQREVEIYNDSAFERLGLKSIGAFEDGIDPGAPDHGLAICKLARDYIVNYAPWYQDALAVSLKLVDEHHWTPAIKRPTGDSQ